MNILTEKSVGSTSTTCSSLHSPKFHYNSDNVNYVNLNFVEASETSSQEKRDLLDQQEMQINQDQQQQNQQCKQDQESQEGQQQEAHQMELQQQAPQEEASQQQLPQQQLPQQQAPQQQAPQQQAPQQQAPQQQAPQQQAPQQKATQQKAPQQQSPQQQAPQQQEFQQHECQQHKHQQQTHQHKESHYEDHHEQQPHHEKHHRQGHDSQELQQQKPQKKESEQKELKQQQPQQQEPQKQEPQKPQQYLNRFLIHTNPVSLNIISSLTLVRPKKATVNPNGPKTLKEMGFNVKRCKHWKRITQPLKTDLNTLLRNLIENFIKPSVQVQIGSIHFNCHMMVLQCYSDFFNKYNNKFFIELPEKQVTPAAFMMAYEWMLTDKPIVQREGIIELLKAAKFLCIKDLLNQCWEFLDDDVRIREDVAFLLYMEARHYGDLENLEQLMIPRISKFFLTLVASYNFLQLTIKDIISFLSSNTIGVTSEAEVFMAAVHWLNHNWENREQYVVTVMKTVRFALLPPYLLVILTKGTDCIEIDRVLSHSEVKDMIIDGMTLSSMRLHYKGNCDQMINFLNRHSLLMPMERQWIRETESDTPITSYKSFMDKLQKIQVIGQDYWRSLEFRTNFEQSCTSFNIKKESNI